MVRPPELEAEIDEGLRGDRDAFREILHAHGLPLRSDISVWVITSTISTNWPRRSS